MGSYIIAHRSALARPECHRVSSRGRGSWSVTHRRNSHDDHELEPSTWAFAFGDQDIDRGVPIFAAAMPAIPVFGFRRWYRAESGEVRRRTSGCGTRTIAGPKAARCFDVCADPRNHAPALPPIVCRRRRHPRTAALPYILPRGLPTANAVSNLVPHPQLAFVTGSESPRCGEFGEFRAVAPVDRG